MTILNLVGFTDSIGLGTVFILGGLGAAYWAIRNSISGTQRNEVEIANAGADRLRKENADLRNLIANLEAKTDLERVIALLEHSQKTGYAKLDSVIHEVSGLRTDLNQQAVTKLDKVASEVAGLREDLDKKAVAKLERVASEVAGLREDLRKENSQ